MLFDWIANSLPPHLLLLLTGAIQSVPIQVQLQRKKSLPDVQELPAKMAMMSREEVSLLGSARREEVRRQIEQSERLKANPLLYLVSPQVKVQRAAYTYPCGRH